jgi:hypothetical protein
MHFSILEIQNLRLFKPRPCGLQFKEGTCLLFDQKYRHGSRSFITGDIYEQNQEHGSQDSIPESFECEANTNSRSYYWKILNKRTIYLRSKGSICY